MTFCLSHKIKLNPTLEQEKWFVKACGVARFTYNLGLEAWNTWYKQGRKFSYRDIRKEFNRSKDENFPWCREVSSKITEYAFENLNQAFSRFFKRNSQYPKFHKKGQNDAFTIYPVKLDGKYVKIPRLGYVKMTESLRLNGIILDRAVISRDGSYWFISITVEVDTDQFKQVDNQNRVGVDLGLSKSVVLSTGEVFKAPKPLQRNLDKLAKVQRRLSRKAKGSSNRHKQLMKLRKLHYKIKSTRLDWIHKVTAYLTSTFKYIAIEDLAVSNMLKNRKLSRAISDIGWYEFKRQILYKAVLHDCEVIVADRFFPSSKTCNSCGVVNDSLRLSDRIFQCDCGHTCDRDLNASLNLRDLIPTAGGKFTPVDSVAYSNRIVQLPKHAD